MVATIVPVTPFIMKNAVIVFGDAATGQDFATACSSAILTPSSGTVEFKGLKPSAVFTFAQAVTYVLELEYAQDWSVEDSLSRYLFDHKGENVPATLNFDDATTGSTSWALTVAVSPGAAGGAVDAVATATATLGVVGEPVPTTTPGAVTASRADVRQK
jgi:hypothetical protein